jgi:hypothetical protein
MSSQAGLALPVTFAELESRLWEAANILRGRPVDRTDWKSYILPLLLLLEAVMGSLDPSIAGVVRRSIAAQWSPHLDRVEVVP